MRRAQPRCPVSPPETKNLLLGKGQSFLRAHFPKAQESGRRRPRDGHVQTVAAGQELAERAEDETAKGAVLQELGQSGILTSTDGIRFF